MEAAEAMAPQAFREAARRAPRALTLKGNSVALTNGVGSVPAGVLVGLLGEPDVVVSDPADATMARKMRHVPEWSEFVRPLTSFFGYFTVRGASAEFYLTRPGASYTPGAGMTGVVELTAHNSPVVPSLASDPVVGADEVLEAALLIIAEGLKGGGG